VTLKVSLNCLRRPTVMTESIPSSDRGRWVSTSSGEERRRTEATSALIICSRCFFKSAGLEGRALPELLGVDFLGDFDFLGALEVVPAEGADTLAFSANHLVKCATVG